MPSVTYRNSDGSTATVDVNQLQNLDPQLYSQYLEKVGQPSAQVQQTQTSTAATGAEIPGIQAESGIKQVQAQQVSSPLNLKKDLTSGMTLKGALSKYTALGMSADDVFKNYLAQSPHGLPKENPTELQGMGIKAETLGRIGDPGSFMDRWNTRNAITELRGLQDTFNKVSTAGHIPVIGNLFDKAYNANKLTVADHLSSLVPGASQSQGSNESFLKQLPDPSNPASVAQADDIFNKIETPLLQSKGYRPEDLGLSPRGNQQDPHTGGSILSNLLNKASTDVSNDVSGIGKEGERLAQTAGKKGTNAAIGQSVMDMLGGAGQEYGSLLQDPIQHLKDHPVNTALDVLPLAGLLKGVMRGGVSAGEAGATAGETATQAAPKTINPPSNVSTLLAPNRAKNIGSQIRDVAVDTSTKAGKTVPGSNISANIKGWFEGQGGSEAMSQYPELKDKIENMAQSYEGKEYTPQQLKDIYDKIENTYTKSGQPLAAQDKILSEVHRQILSKELDHIAPGWQKGTSTIAKGFQAEKSPARGLAKSALRLGLGIGVPAAGADAIAHYLFGGK